MSRKRTLIIGGLVVLLLLLLEILCAHPHVFYWWHGLIGFDFIFGFWGALLLLGLAKGLINPLIQREEDYYGEGRDSHD